MRIEGDIEQQRVRKFAELGNGRNEQPAEEPDYDSNGDDTSLAATDEVAQAQRQQQARAGGWLLGGLGCGNEGHCSPASSVRTTRKPRLLAELSGVFELRAATR